MKSCFLLDGVLGFDEGSAILALSRDVVGEVGKVQGLKGVCFVLLESSLFGLFDLIGVLEGGVAAILAYDWLAIARLNSLSASERALKDSLRSESEIWGLFEGEVGSLGELGVEAMVARAACFCFFEFWAI